MPETELEVAQRREAEAAAAMAEVLKEIETTTQEHETLEETPGVTDVEPLVRPAETQEQVETQEPEAVKPAEQQPEKEAASRPSDHVFGEVLVKILDRLESLEKREVKPEVKPEAKPAQPDVSVETLRRLMRTNPVEAYKLLGVSAADVSRLTLAHTLGDKAPPEIREAAARSAQDNKIAELEAKLAARDAEEARQAAESAQVASQRKLVEDTQANIRTYVKEHGNKYARVSIALKNDSAKVHEDILMEVAKQAQKDVAAGRPNAPLLKTEDAVKLVEAEYERLAKFVASQNDNGKIVRPPPKPVTATVYSDRPDGWGDEVKAALTEAIAIAKGQKK